MKRIHSLVPISQMCMRISSLLKLYCAHMCWDLTPDSWFYSIRVKGTVVGEEVKLKMDFDKWLALYSLRIWFSVHGHIDQEWRSRIWQSLFYHLIVYLRWLTLTVNELLEANNYILHILKFLHFLSACTFFIATSGPKWRSMHVAIYF